MRRSKDDEMARLATRQLSLITTANAATVGLTGDAMQYRASSGRLVRVRRGVARVAGSAPTWEQTVLAACLAAGDPIAASDLTAMCLHGFAGASRPRVIELSVPVPRQPRLAGVRIHRVLALDAADITRLGGIPVTAIARTVIDVASRLSSAQLDRMVNDLFRRELLTVDMLAASADRAIEAGLRRPMQKIERLIAERSDGFHPGESDPEVWMVTTLVAAGLPRPIQQYKVRARGQDYRLDAAYPDLMVGMEYDGEDGHARPGDLQRDRRRLNDLTAMGWDIRFATKGTTSREFVADVRAACERARRLL